MNVAEVAALFKSYVEEADTSWLTDANVATYLGIAYEEFREFVMQYCAEIYVTSVDLVLNAQDQYELDGAEPVVIMGDPGVAALTHDRLRSILAIVQQDTGTAILDQRGFVELVTSWRSLIGQSQKAYLAGNTLHLSEPMTRTLTLYYVPHHSVDWTQFPSPADEYIDELFPYHDLIALYAVAQYSVRDGEVKEATRYLIERREKALQAYLARRATEDVSYVERTARSYRSFI